MSKKNTHSILIIDDDPRILSGIKFYLNQHGYKVILAADAMNAQKVLEEETPDLILCDVMMPEVNGFEFRKVLSQNPVTTHIPFIFLTARSARADMLCGLEAGGDDYITKPFDREELLARINALLRRVEKDQVQNQTEIDTMLDTFRSEVLNNIRHELYTPLGQLMLSLEIVLKERYHDPEDMRNFLVTAAAGAGQLNFMLDNVVTLMNLDQGKSNLMKTPVDLQFDFYEPIKDRTDNYQDKELELVYLVEEDLDFSVPRSPFRLAVQNLVDNALKFSPKKNRVLIELHRIREDGVELVVSNRGSHIPEELREKVFERFYQVSQGDTRKYGGLGIGLTVTREIARGWGGDVVILPTSRGCSIRFRFPV